MAFNLTFHNILDNNIKHIYSGKPTHPVYRAPTEFQRPTGHDDVQTKKQVVKSSDYIHEHKCFIPKAQAFRCLSRDEVDSIVKRLRQPTLSSEASGKTSEELSFEETALATPRYMGIQTVSKAEQDESVHNLGRPTQMSSLRERSKSKMPEVQT